MFPNIPKGIPLAIDYETTGLQYWLPDFRVLGVAIATDDAQWYWDLKRTPEVVQWLKDTLPGRILIAQNAQYDLQCSRVLGIDPRSVDWYCTMVSQCLIYEHHPSYGLAKIASYLGIDSQKERHLDALQAALGVLSHKQALERLEQAPFELVAAYGASDARDAYDIYTMQKVMLEEQDLMRVHRLEMDLLPVLADMSWGGVRVDIEAAHKAIPMLDQKEFTLQQEINNIAGRNFNVNSSPQVREFFQPKQISKFEWQLMDGSVVGPTKGGDAPCLDQNALREIKHPMAQKIVELRKATKLRDTFIRGHVLGSADPNGYVHTSFNQTRNDEQAGTVTGRLSSTDPALQQITKRDKGNAAILRAMFLPDGDEQWLCADYSQVDFRCGAHLQNDPSVIAAYEENPKLDYHQIVSDMTGIPRNPPYAGAPNTKQINLSLSFGAGVGKLAYMMGMPYELKEKNGKMQFVAGEEAIRIFNLYHEKLPAVKRFLTQATTVAKSTGFVKTQTGRRLRFPKGQGTHKAGPFLCQSYAADLHKAGLVAVDAAIRQGKLPARLMMSCHDEIGVSMHPDEVVKAQILREYTDFGPDAPRVRMRVPIQASADYGANWYEASKG